MALKNVVFDYCFSVFPPKKNSIFRPFAVAIHYGHSDSIHFPGLRMPDYALSSGRQAWIGARNGVPKSLSFQIWRSLAELCGVNYTKALLYEIVKKRHDLFRQFLENLRMIPTLTAPLIDLN